LSTYPREDIEMERTGHTGERARGSAQHRSEEWDQDTIGHIYGDDEVDDPSDEEEEEEFEDEEDEDDLDDDDELDDEEEDEEEEDDL